MAKKYGRVEVSLETLIEYRLDDRITYFIEKKKMQPSSFSYTKSTKSFIPAPWAKAEISLLTPIRTEENNLF